MSKFFLVTLLAAAGTVLWTDDAQARCRRGRGMQTPTWSGNTSCSTCTAGTTIAPTTMAMTPQPSVTVAPSNTASSYQSYSYEPGQNNGSTPVNSAIGSAVMARAPGASRSNAFEYNNVLRGDRKVRGHTAEGEWAIGKCRPAL